jgi:hypothetical protein
MVLLLGFARHFMWSRSDGQGGTTSFYYDDEITWLIAVVVLILIAWFLLKGYLRARRLRRPPPPPLDRKSLNQALRVKNELSRRYLRPGVSNRIHAVGVGKTGSGSFCVQIFLTDNPTEELWTGAGAATPPAIYKGVPLELIEMPAAAFLEATPQLLSGSAVSGIRERCEVITGGISGANSNLRGQSGTIGYFCTRRSRIRRRKQIHLLSNSHVFADLGKQSIDRQDLIMQPSPGEAGSNRPIAALVDYSALTFDDREKPNHIDAAVAQLWDRQPHEPVIPFVGSVQGYARKTDVQIGECARKFGRTTGYSEGSVFSIYLDIWIHYDRTGRAAFFKDQFLIEPASEFTRFVDKGDSGSLILDAAQHAIGLVFAGTAEMPVEVKPPSGPIGPDDNAATVRKRIEGYGVANPISEVLDRMKIDLVVPDKPLSPRL